MKNKRQNEIAETLFFLAIIALMLLVLFGCQPMYEITVQCDHKYKSPWYEGNQYGWEYPSEIILDIPPADGQYLIFEEGGLTWGDQKITKDNNIDLTKKYPYPPKWVFEK